jgi:L-lysine 6-transaminase
MSIKPDNVHETLAKYILVDGFDFVFDLKKSKGCQIYNSRSGKYLLDCFSFFASAPIGYNHPKLMTPEFIKKLGKVAVNKPSNSDIFTTEMAEFMDSFGENLVPDYFNHLFFISGGALAVENALKTAFDWKVRKNIIQGNGENLGKQVIHFRESFHGRTGYTLSLTDTFNKNKVKYFTKFDWPRIINPKITFPLNEENLGKVKELERQAKSQIETAIQNNPNDIAALIIEPIQAEGGDHHIRKEFFIELRKICDDEEIMFIIDEVQTGVGITGKMWAHEHFDIKPDILAFGKKTQICGIMVGKRVDEIKDNVFVVKSRLNSTWAGNLVDMVRCQKYIEVINEENLVRNAEIQGKHLLQGLEELGQKYPEMMFNARGRGLMCAFDVTTTEQRDELVKQLQKNGLIIVGCGRNSIRFRPALIISSEEIDKALEIIDTTIKKI